MTPDQFLAWRNAYAYPAVGLVGSLHKPVHYTFPSIRSMEDHHRSLLRSHDDELVVFGYLSVVYWGHFSGKNGIRSQRALAKVKMARDGTDRSRKGKAERMSGVADIGVAAIAGWLRRAMALVDAGQYGSALKVLSKEVPQLNFAFASKVCAFLLPEQCGVVDSVIAQRREFGFEVDANGYVRNNITNASTYTLYCLGLSKRANELNNSGPAFRWRDLDDAMCTWRAVDVERAMYHATQFLTEAVTGV